MYKRQVRSWNVMAITFTNKAAGELNERLRRMLGGEEGDEGFASTFHSACVRILRRWAEEIGYPRKMCIRDSGIPVPRSSPDCCPLPPAQRRQG